MSWVFYALCVEVVITCILCFMMFKNFYLCDALPACIIICVLAGGTMFLTGLIRGLNMPYLPFSARVEILENRDESRPMKFTVAACTLFLDGVRTYVLQPGECKQLSTLRGGYRVLSERYIEQKHDSRERNTDTVASRYEALIK